MAKEKHNAESFLHPAERGLKMKRIIKRFGSNGYVMWYSLLELLSRRDHYYIVANDDDLLEEVSEYCLVKPDQIIEFMNYLVDKYPTHFNLELWKDYRVIRNDKLVEEHRENLYRKDDNDKSNRRKGKVMEINEIKQKEKLTKFKETKPNGIELNITKRKESKEGESKGSSDSLGESSENVFPAKQDVFLPKAGDYESEVDITTFPTTKTEELW